MNDLAYFEASLTCRCLFRIAETVPRFQTELESRLNIEISSRISNDTFYQVENVVKILLSTELAMERLRAEIEEELNKYRNTRISLVYLTCNQWLMDKVRFFNVVMNFLFVTVAENVNSVKEKINKMF